MKPFLGLFAHWDVIARQEPPGFLGRYFRDSKDAEYKISKSLKEKIASSLLKHEKRIGGNGANAAVTLSDLGIPCMLSCPARAGPFMRELEKHRIFLMSGVRESSPTKCSRQDEAPEHIVFEMEGYRKIFNYDHVQRKFLLDHDFWNSLKNANYLFLCGFHAVPEEQKKKADEIADYLEGRKFKVHLELGYGKGLMKYAIRRLLDRNCIDSLGMNETELGVLGIREESQKEVAECILSFLEVNGLERVSLHSRDCRITAFKKDPEKNLKAAELSIQACAAKALGGIRENMEKAESIPYSGIKPYKGKDFFITPARVMKNPKIIVGMGDTAAVVDSYYALK
jgi:ADP-dependent phosphofructokinase/glucokinase